MRSVFTSKLFIKCLSLLRLPGLKPQLPTYLNTYMNSKIQHVCNKTNQQNEATTQTYTKHIMRYGTNVKPLNSNNRYSNLATGSMLLQLVTWKTRCLIKLACASLVWDSLMAAGVGQGNVHLEARNRPRLKMHTSLPHANCPQAILNKSRIRLKQNSGGGVGPKPGIAITILNYEWVDGNPWSRETRNDNEYVLLILYSSCLMGGCNCLTTYTPAISRL